MKRTTSSGFTFTVNEKLKNDFRFVVALSDMTNGDADAQLAGSASLVRIVLGEQGARALYKHVAESDGTVPTDKIMQEITEIIRLSGESEECIKN